MSKMYFGSIDVSKIDKAKLVKGEKGTYLNITVWVNDELDKFGNIASVQQGQTKEEREAKQPKIYLGNLKTPEERTEYPDNSGGQPTQSPPIDDLGF